MWRSIFIAALIAVGVGAWIISGQIGENPQQPEVKKPPVELTREVKLQSVRTRTYRAESFVQNITLAATTAADKKTMISSEITGRLAEVRISKGDRVEVGDVIAVVETDTREASLRQAKAALDQAKADNDSAEKLAARGFVSKNRVRQTQAALSSAEANLEAAQNSLDNLTIVSTVTGLVESVAVETGSLAAQGAPIATIVSVDPLLIVAEASEQDIGSLKLGDKAKATTVSGMELDGTITFIASTANAATRTFRIEISAPNPTRQVLEGMSAQVTLPRGERTAHLIPATLMSLGSTGEIGIKYITGGDTVAFAAADLVNATPNGVWLEGLPAEVTVITVGQEFVKVGERVKTVDAAALANNQEG